MAHSLVMIPVPELDPVVRPRLARSSPGLVPADPDDPVAHITLLGPFASHAHLTDGVLDELADFFADVTPFGFSLRDVARFPGGTVYLAPDPAAPFRSLTHELMHRFPEYPPYGGAFDEVVPHLSVPLPDDEDEDSLRRELSLRLPITAHALEASLYWWSEDGSRTLATFPFGMSAA